MAPKQTKITKYAYLVRIVAKALSKKIPDHMSFDDFMSAGYMGLINAVDKFDDSKGIKFATYAGHRIKGYILDEMRKHDHYTRRTRWHINRIKKTVIEIEEIKRRPAKTSEICENLGISLEKFQKIRTNIDNQMVFSLDEYKPATEKTGANNLKRIELKQNRTGLNDLLEKENLSLLSEALKALSDRERFILQSYYFDGIFQKEIGISLKLTESRVHQIRAEALKKLKTVLKEQHSK